VKFPGLLTCSSPASSSSSDDFEIGSSHRKRLSSAAVFAAIRQALSRGEEVRRRAMVRPMASFRRGAPAGVI
jgi:hypothetical protein